VLGTRINEILDVSTSKDCGKKENVAGSVKRGNRRRPVRKEWWW
jgi:hypothetical protein